jgi:3-oxoacyl-[acyl-carrier protein] reductase
MLLEDKNAVIYGAGGSIAGAVARAFARKRARCVPRRAYP